MTEPAEPLGRSDIQVLGGSAVVGCGLMIGLTAGVIGGAELILLLV
jgi:hypothetical protein